MSILKASETWFAGKDFSTDWATRKLPNWERQFKPYADQPINVLELGSYEGRSAIAFLNMLPKAHLTCVDLFPTKLEVVFDKNMEEYSSRIRKLKGDAKVILRNLADEGCKYEIVYADAGKMRDHVYKMTNLTWPLVQPGGLIFWDDYTWGKDKSSDERPKEAIDQFLSENADDLEILQIASQVFARKRVK